MLHRLFPLALLLLAATGLLTAEPPSRMAIRGARVYTVSGPVLEKATVLIKDGLIEAVGENVPIPAGVTVIDGTGLNVYPGLIDALSTWGIAELAAPATPAGGARGAAPPATFPATRKPTRGGCSKRPTVAAAPCSISASTGSTSTAGCWLTKL